MALLLHGSACRRARALARGLRRTGADACRAAVGRTRHPESRPAVRQAERIGVPARVGARRVPGAACRDRPRGLARPRQPGAPALYRWTVARARTHLLTA